MDFPQKEGLIRAPVRGYRSIFYIGAAVCGWSAFLLVGEAHGENLVFKNGQQQQVLRIVTRTETFITVEVESGIVRYPLNTLTSIDGQPVGGPAVAASTPAGASGTSGDLKFSEPQGSPGTGFMAASAPAPSASPASPGAAVESAPPEAAAATVKPASDAGDRWNFEIFLVGYLVGAGVWMRGLQAVQRDLHERREEPRYWTMAALLLPGVGAGAYFATKWSRERLAEIQARKWKASPEPEAPEPAPSGTGQAFPFAVPTRFDPAAHVARQGRTRKGLTFLDMDRQSVVVTGNGELASGLDNASEVLEEALLEKASDIHIEPTSDSYRVRFRLDGILHERTSYDPADGIRIVTALKSLAQIDVAEKRRAQDGKFRVKSEEREVDFRVATANSIYGEKMVIRVLDHRGGIFDLASLGMSEEMLTQFRQAVHSRNGMILATGPTGSGKTSTLYAALRELDATSLNIMTIEDPPEYELAGATQIAVSPRAGITYEAGLRSILRQDPDVILVGEMRDAEATGVALRAALTGHLVLSTLHTRDAIGTISRLQDMGVERYQVASALLMVLAQRLVRVLCPDCRREYPAVGNELESIGFSFDPGVPLYAAQGCDACHGTGYRGRTGLFELLVLDEEFRRALGEGADETVINELAAQRGFRNYRYDGAEKALLGITTIEEVLQAS
jgi:type II secretory ATPase GspE/PulE/Tfp pilus assembly ATPase PilB-like protein